LESIKSKLRKGKKCAGKEGAGKNSKKDSREATEKGSENSVAFLYYTTKSV